MIEFIATGMMVATVECVAPAKPSIPATVSSKVEAEAAQKTLYTYISSSFDYEECVELAFQGGLLTEEERKTLSKERGAHVQHREKLTRDVSEMINPYR